MIEKFANWMILTGHTILNKRAIKRKKSSPRRLKDAETLPSETKMRPVHFKRKF